MRQGDRVVLCFGRSVARARSIGTREGARPPDSRWRTGTRSSSALNSWEGMEDGRTEKRMNERMNERKKEGLAVPKLRVYFSCFDEMGNRAARQSCHARSCLVSESIPPSPPAARLEPQSTMGASMVPWPRLFAALPIQSIVVGVED